LKSLLSFSENAESNKLMRVYSGALKKEQISSGDKKRELLSLPFYLVNKIFDFC